MLHRWVNRLVKSETRRQKLLRKPRCMWPFLIQTGDQGTLKSICTYRQSFPERICVNVELRPSMVVNKTVTAQANLDNHVSLQQRSIKT